MFGLFGKIEVKVEKVEGVRVVYMMNDVCSGSRRNGILCVR